MSNLENLNVQLNDRYTRPLRILFLQAEIPRWSQANSYPYYAHFALMEALQDAGIEVVMVTTTWYSHLQDICMGQSFDQIWINDMSHFADLKISLKEVAELAPIRVGFVIESLEYHPEEYKQFSWLADRRSKMDAQFEYLTHVVAMDEQDVVNINRRFNLPTMWLPCSMPERFICEESPAPSHNMAFFSGTVYGERKKYLADSRLKDLLARSNLKSADYFYGLQFDMLPSHRFGFPTLIKQSFFPTSLIYPIYLNMLRHIRQKAFRSWQQSVLQKGAAVVNLPSLVKAHSGRVIEGIAADRPVISWQPPNRPYNEALLKNEEEILLYSTLEELVIQIERVLSDSDFRQQIAGNARRKVKKFHTSEKRVEQILDWLVSGDAPTYGVSSYDG